MEILREDTGLGNLVDAIIKALDSGPRSQDHEAAVMELSKTVNNIDNDLAKACTLLNEKIKALE